MRKSLLVIIMVFAVPGCSSVHQKKEATMDLTIEEAIKAKKDRHQIAILTRFLEAHKGAAERISVVEHETRYEITVHRTSSASETGGAEQYFLDKTTGEWKMGWHEHPMPLQKE